MAKDKADRATAQPIIQLARKRRVEVLDETDLRRKAANKDGRDAEEQALA